MQKLIIVITVAMNLTLWVYYCELDRRYMNHLQADRLIESAQNEVIMLNTQQNNHLTDYVVKLSKQIARYKDN